MKKHFILPVMIASLFMAIPFVSCSDDDEAFEAAVAAARARESQKPAPTPTPTPPPEPPAPENVTVTFDVNGGTALATSEYTFETGKSFRNGSGLNYLPITTKEGYDFQNWNTKPDGTGSSLTNIYQTINSTITYYAYWKPLITKVETTVTNYVDLEIGEQKTFTFKYEPADASTNWSNTTGSGNAGVSCTIKDNHDGYVEYTLSGTYARTGIFTITESKSNKAYSIEVTVKKPSNLDSLSVITPGAASSTNPADYVGLDKTLDSTTPMVLYKLNLEANTAYTFQTVTRNNQDTIGVTDLGFCSIWLYNSGFTGTISTTSIAGGFECRPTSATTCYLAIQKYSNQDVAKGGVHVYKKTSVTSISLAQTNLNLASGSEGQYIDLTITPNDAYKSISVTSSNYSVADGWYSYEYWDNTTQSYIQKDVVYINPRGVGTATITITDRATNISASCDVTVTGTNLTDLVLSQNTLSISQGETKTLTLTATPENAIVSYYSSSGDYRIARCSRSGSTITVTGGVVPGSITYTIYDDYSNKSASCTITNSTGITGAAVTDELPVVGTAASDRKVDYTIATLNNAQPVKYYKVVVPSSNFGKKYNFQTARAGNNPIVGDNFNAGNCYFYLYDENFTNLTSTSSGTIQRTLNAGTYYFAIVYGSPYDTYNYSAQGGVHLYVTN